MQYFFSVLFHLDYSMFGAASPGVCVWKKTILSFEFPVWYRSYNDNSIIFFRPGKNMLYSQTITSKVF